MTTIEKTAIALGITAGAVLSQTMVLRDRIGTRLAQAEDAPETAVVLFVEADGAKHYVNADDMSRPYGADKATIFNTLDDAIGALLESTYGLMLALSVSHGGAVDVLKGEHAFLVRSIDEFTDSAVERILGVSPDDKPVKVAA